MAARRAGWTPKNVPTKSANTAARAKGSQETTTGIGETLDSTTETPQPKPVPKQHPQERHGQGLGKELQEHVPSGGTHGPAQADFLGPLGHGDQQDVHQHDAPDQEAQPGESTEQKGQRSARCPLPTRQ